MVIYIWHTVITFDVLTHYNYIFYHFQGTPFNPSIFGTSLEEALELQVDQYPDLDIPWVILELCETVLRLRGPNTQGIFRYNYVKPQFLKFESLSVVMKLVIKLIRLLTLCLDSLDKSISTNLIMIK